MAAPAQPGVELTEELYAALNGRDMDTFFGLLHEDVEVREEFLGPDVAVYRGHDGVREWLRRSSEAMSDFRWEPRRFILVGDSVVIPVRLTARGSGSGAEVTAELIHMGQMRDGKVSLLAAFPDLQSAVHAADLAVQVGEEPWDSPEGAALRDALEAELCQRYGGDSEPGAKPTAEDTLAFFVAREDGVAIGCGGLRELQDGAIELKRMYVRPEDRGRGLGWLILITLEAEAARRGFTTIRLETGRFQPEAMALYRAAGYRQIPSFGPYDHGEHSTCFERRIVG
jgi:putative acetyltransferase